MKKILIKLMNRLPHFVTLSVRCYDELTRVNDSSFFFLVFFSEENCIQSHCFLFITIWFSLDFWWNYFLNNLSLLGGLLKLVSLLMVHSYFHHDHRSAEFRYIFWWHMFFNNSFYIASHGGSINRFFWTCSFLFL